MAEERIQRRLAAILAADVVGFSRLMDADESGTLTALKSRRKDVLDPLVARSRGCIFKVTGDGVLVEFASAVNAVQSAVDLQLAMATANSDQPTDRHIVLRIGVNLGDVMVVGRDLHGDGVNIAARLQALAEPGGILVSGTTYEYVRNKVMFVADPAAAPRTNRYIYARPPVIRPMRYHLAASAPAIQCRSGGQSARIASGIRALRESCLRTAVGVLWDR